MYKLPRVIISLGYSYVLIQLFQTYCMNRFEVRITMRYIYKSASALIRHHKDLQKYPKNVTVIDLDFIPPRRLPTDLKYILKYTTAFNHYTASSYMKGQNSFLWSNCTYQNCYFTNDQSLLVDIRNFDAIMFDVENVWEDFPSIRSLHQRYIFTASEPAAQFPRCDEYFDDFYNWTWSYKLDSDIKWIYMNILDKNGTVVGPKINMTWVEHMKPTPNNIKEKLLNKTKAAAWFVSNCMANNQRFNVMGDIRNILNKYGYEIDVYGWCGNLTCPLNRIDECNKMLETDYFFYLAFENSNCEDYVTEKILYPLQHYSVPIVYGGADYSRFLPPGSYINAKVLSPKQVATLMIEAMRIPKRYANYFKWHNHYVYEEVNNPSDVCTLCRLLNEEHNRSTVHDLRMWWYPNYEEWCKVEAQETIHHIQL